MLHASSQYLPNGRVRLAGARHIQYLKWIRLDYVLAPENILIGATFDG